MVLKRHISFLRIVFLHSITAFGGPQMHLIKVFRYFVFKNRYISSEELMELNAFVQLLPGASSSQVLTLIAYKRGGTALAALTLFIWILPASLLMGLLSFVLLYTQFHNHGKNIFQYIQPMAVGFLAFSSYKSYNIFIRHNATHIIMIVALLVTIFIKSPWVFPILIIGGSVVSNFSDKRIPKSTNKPSPIKWGNLWGFIALFIIIGLLSETARINDWYLRKPINLFENFYRFGSLVFGGGGVLIPMMFQQYVIRAKTQYMSAEEFLTGAGMVQAFPGPTFSLASFMGGMVMADMGLAWQAAGCLIGSVAIFLPSFLLVVFFYPIWNNLKQHVAVFRAMEGINAVVVGIMAASTIVLFTSISSSFDWINLVAVIVTFCFLQFTQLPSPIIVIMFLLLGWYF